MILAGLELRFDEGAQANFESRSGTVLTPGAAAAASFC